MHLELCQVGHPYTHMYVRQHTGQEGTGQKFPIGPLGVS